MKKLIPLLVFCLFLLGSSECTTPVPPPPPGPQNFYCAPAVVEPFVEMTILDKFLESIKNQMPDTIVGGTPSVDRRSTFFMSAVGVGSCTAVALGPHTALTAAHCRAKDAWTTTPPELRLYEDPSKTGSYYIATSHLMHPGYQPSSKQSDLMLMYFDDPIPGPYIAGIYNETMANSCEDMIAQGWGQTEAIPEKPCPDGARKCLRESKYMVESYLYQGVTLISKQRTPGGICFGDSGGPLYAIVTGEAGPFLSGITSWTQTHDCKVRSGHVNVDYHKAWIYDNFNGPNVKGTFQ